MDVLDVRGGDEDEVARDAVDPDRGAPGLGVAAGDRESLLLHRGQDVPLQEAEMGELVDEEHPLVGLVDDAGNDPLVGQRPELGMAAVRVVPDVPEELRLGRAGGHQERVPVEPDEHLARALVLERPPALERPLVEDLDLLARPARTRRPPRPPERRRVVRTDSWGLPPGLTVSSRIPPTRSRNGLPLPETPGDICFTFPQLGQYRSVGVE